MSDFLYDEDWGIALYGWIRSAVDNTSGSFRPSAGKLASCHLAVGPHIAADVDVVSVFQNCGS